MSDREPNEQLEDDPLARQREMERERGLGRGPDDGVEETPPPRPDEEETEE